MDIVLIPILKAILSILNFYQLIIFVNIILSWLIMFGIIDIYKFRIVGNIFMFTRAVTEPIFALVRRIIPTLGPMDFSPIVIILGIYIISEILTRVIYKLSVMAMY
ncbi:YggT family protein [Rickettsiales bacterium LUAb2]